MALPGDAAAAAAAARPGSTRYSTDKYPATAPSPYIIATGPPLPSLSLPPPLPPRMIPSTTQHKTSPFPAATMQPDPSAKTLAASDQQQLRRPQYVRSSSSLSTISTLSSDSSDSLPLPPMPSSTSTTAPASVFSPLQQQPLLPLPQKRKVDITITESEDGQRQSGKGRPFEWSPLPWAAYADVPGDWWLSKVDERLEELAICSDEDEVDDRRGRTGGSRRMTEKEGMICAVYDDEEVETSKVDEEEDEDDDGYYICEEPEEIHEYDSRGRPILKVLTNLNRRDDFYVGRAGRYD
ncbi:hypothetical protein BZA70DRAFT_269418 [Myxozyma melibiosi]|uniref:Uncharacterized protein n=1 Tax=Myxozyma melibiosi TaxID=54550 RepID=A0ABR1F036_9ASCO